MKLSGQVLDSNNEPLASANVTLRSGTQAGKIGVVTNLDGNFSMDSETIKPESVFEISFIGFVSQKYTALELQDRKINLLDSIEDLKEVIVIDKKKPKVFIASSNKNTVGEHFKKYKTVYISGGMLAGILILISKLKK